MIKLLLTGIWGVVLLSGSIYLFAPDKNEGNTEALDNTKPFFGKLETIVLNTMSVAFIRKNAVQGYVILDVAFTVDAAKHKLLSVPIKLILQNAVNNSFLANRDLNINRLDSFDAEVFEERLADEINEKIGDKLLKEVMIQRIDFLTSEDVRDTKLRGG